MSVESGQSQIKAVEHQHEPAVLKFSCASQSPREFFLSCLSPIQGEKNIYFSLYFPKVLKSITHNSIRKIKLSFLKENLEKGLFP